MTAKRADRLHPTDRPEDQRSAFSRDRDRILYCSAFRRLAEVTQVVSADEGHVFHNRLTHTLKVAQIARRLAEMLVQKESATVSALGDGIDPEVAEAAALAHDLGHPPFGHVIEKELNELANKNEETDGFEGNAQSFRIITKLAVRHPEQVDGLNLTRATLNATLKYPWYRATSGPHKGKWGVYHSEKTDFEFARDGHQFGIETRCPEAEIMDWADDIAYSVHDVEDFYRAGLIPLDRILADPEELDRFLAESVKRRVKSGVSTSKADADAQAFRELVRILPPRRLDGRFRGTTAQRAGLRSITSFLVSRYVIDVHLRVPTEAGQSTLSIEPQFESEVAMLKQLVWHYVIENPSLATQQHGQRRAIRELFRIFFDATTGDWGIFSIPHRELLEAAEKSGALQKERVRIIIDLISSMTERQAIRLYQRLSGVSLGSVLDQLG